MGVFGRSAFAGLVAATFVGLLAVSPATAAAELAALQVPFQCEANRGAVVLRANAPSRLAIIGPREQRVVRICRQARVNGSSAGGEAGAAGAKGDTGAAGAGAASGPVGRQSCRSIVAHKFAVRCGSERIAWADVAAAIVANQGGRAWLREGRLRVAAAGRSITALVRSCAAALSEGHAASAVPDPICEHVWSASSGAGELVFPPGFAPVGEIGARFLAAAPSTSDRDRLRTLAASTAPRAMATGGAGPESPAQDISSAILEQQILPTPDDARAAVASAARNWITLVEIERPTDGGGPAALIGLLAAASLLTGLAWLAHRAWLQRDVPVGVVGHFEVIVRPDTVTLARPEAELCGELCKTARGLLTQIVTAVDDLRGVPQLRRILVRETRHLQTYLGALLATTPVEPLDWRRLRVRLQRTVGDLMRLRDIVEAAGTTFNAADARRDAPRDRDEAYAALGANPAVDLKLVKKLVDALRANWHPDHAVDTADRVLREERIKEINIAWDLVSGARAET